MSLGRMRMKEGGTWLKASFLACGISLRQRLGIQDTDLSIAIKLRVVNINLNSGCLTSSGSAGLQVVVHADPRRNCSGVIITPIPQYAD